MAKIYVASSWRNPYFPEVVEALRAAGHEVYDFRNPPHGGAGFHWTDIDENAPGFWAKGITLIRANFVKKTMHFARYRNKSAIVMVSLAMSEYPFRERP